MAQVLTLIEGLIMGKKHYYDRHGNYRGYSSNKGPYQGCAVLIAVVVFVMLIKSC